MQDLKQYCSLNGETVCPELVEGRAIHRSWFDMLTMNGEANNIEVGAEQAQPNPTKPAPTSGGFRYAQRQPTPILATTVPTIQPPFLRLMGFGHVIFNESSAQPAFFLFQ